MGSQLPPELLQNIFRYVPESYNALRDTNQAFRGIVNMDVQAARAQVERMHQTQTYLTILSDQRNSLLVRAAAADHLLDTSNQYYAKEVFDLGVKLHDVKYILYNHLSGNLIRWKRVFDVCQEDSYFRQLFVTKFARQVYLNAWETELYKYIVDPRSSKLHQVMTMTRNDTFTDITWSLFPDYSDLVAFMFAFLLKEATLAFVRTADSDRDTDLYYPDVNYKYLKWVTHWWSADQEALDALLKLNCLVDDEYVRMLYERGYDAAQFTELNNVTDWGRILPFVPPQRLEPLLQQLAPYVDKISIDQNWTVALYQQCRKYFGVYRHPQRGGSSPGWLDASVVSDDGYPPGEIVRYMIAQGDARFKLFLGNAHRLTLRLTPTYDIIKALRGYQFTYEEYFQAGGNSSNVLFLMINPPLNLPLRSNGVDDFLVAAETGRRYSYRSRYEYDLIPIEFVLRKMYPRTETLTQQLPEDVKVALRGQGLIEVV